MRLFRSRLFTACVASAAAALVVGGIAWAQIPATNGVITGCYNNKSGALRVIDTSKTTCVAKTETQLEWNQQGVAGATGATGATGANGSNGAPGASGVVSVTLLDRLPFTIALDSTWQMIDAPGTPVTVAAGQKLVISLDIPLQASTGTGTVFMRLCSDAVPLFGESLSSSQAFPIGPTLTQFSLSGASTSIGGGGDLPISAGTYHVGLCVTGLGSTPIITSGGQNETGFAMVVNSS